MSTCPLCNGSQQRLYTVQDPLSGLKKVVVEPCLCWKSKHVSEQYPLLSGLGDNYLPLDKIHEDLIFKPENLLKSPSLKINCSFDTFCYQIKSVIMKYRFSQTNPRIYLCRAIDILQKFHVPQADGETPHLSALDEFDLLIFTCDTYESNVKLDGCIAQVVNNRKNRKPTWMHYAKPFASCKYEYSEMLEEMLKDYKAVNIEDGGSKKGITKTVNDAANF